MSEQWYCEIAGREIGPLSPVQLQSMAAKGQIMPSDCVRQGSEGVWIPAQQVKGLFEPSAVPRKPPAIPVPSVENAPPASQTSEPALMAQPPLPPPLRMSTLQPAPSPSTRLLLNQKRRMRQQKMMVAWLGVAILGLAILAMVLIVRSHHNDNVGPESASASSSGETINAKKVKKKAENAEALDDIESLDPAKPLKKAASKESDAVE
jgi:hypothetical protein